MRVFLALVLFILLYPDFSVNARETSLNDLDEISQGKYRVTGLDPYLLLNVSKDDIAYEGVLLTLNIENWSFKGGGEPSIQLFWADNVESISSKNMMRSDLRGSVNRIYFPLKKVSDGASLLRVDFEQCLNCVIDVLAEPSNEPDDLSTISLPTGFDQYMRVYNGFDIDVLDWSSRNLKSNGDGAFTYKTLDPQIFNSTPISVSTDIAKGIYLEFEYNNAGAYQIYELFWYHQGLPVSGARSAHFLLERRDDEHYKVFLPFDRIYSKRKLLHLRFDFEPFEGSAFKLLKSRIVGVKEVDEYSSFIPERLYYVHSEAPPASVVKSAIVDKLNQDIGFFVFWGGLIVLVFFFGLRAFFIRF